MKLTKTLHVLFLALLASFLAGCGGGGASGEAGGESRLAVFASDSLENDYDHVWVKIFQVSLEGQTSKVVFDDPNGMALDLKTLRDASGARYAFLGDDAVNPGTYPQVRVVLDESLVLVPKGSTTSESRLFAEQHAIVGSPGRSQLTMRTPSEIRNGQNELVLDFDLGNWNLDSSGRVVAVLARGNGNGLGDHNRHEFNDISGTVNGLTGSPPNQSFRLARTRGNIRVETSANTAIFHEGATGNPALANGQRVEVYGVFVRGAFQARTIKIEDESTDDPHKIKGVASNPVESAGTFDVKVSYARGFVPSQPILSVATSAETRFLADSGAPMTKAEFFAALAVPGTMVEAEGTANGTTFNATKAKLEVEDDEIEADLRGPVIAINGVTGTLAITVREWFGMGFTDGQAVDVVTTVSTQYRLRSGNVSREAFFAAVRAGTRVEAKGRYDGVRLSAMRLKADD